MCGVRNVTILTEHFVVEFTEDGKVVGSFVVPNFQDFIVDVHGSVTKERIVCIKDEINDFISDTRIETIAEPIETIFDR